MYKRLTYVFLTFFMLSACAETQLLIHTAKRMGQNNGQPDQQGYYKIGNPYQIKGIWYYPAVNYDYNQTGIASWYGPGFNGKMTANGETYDQNAMTAAHKTLPLPSIVQVTNLENGRSIKVTVNDRGPYASGRIIDMSRRGAQLLGFHRKGIARVRVQILAKESRMLAHSMKSGATLAKIGTPISQNINVAKQGVSSAALAPPPGAKIQIPTRRYIEKEIAGTKQEKANKPPKKLTTLVSNEPVTQTEMYVQAGAFTRFDYANRTAARLAELGNIKVTSYQEGGKEYFRVRAGPIPYIDNADSLLERVIRAGFTDARIVVD